MPLPCIRVFKVRGGLEALLGAREAISRIGGGIPGGGLAGQNKSSSTVSCARKAEGFVKARTQAHTRETSQPAAGGAF